MADVNIPDGIGNEDSIEKGNKSLA